MNIFARLALAAALLVVIITAGLHPGSGGSGGVGVLLSNPLACVGVGLIGLGLIRHHQQQEPAA